MKRRPDYLGWVVVIGFIAFVIAALAIGWNAE